MKRGLGRGGGQNAVGEPGSGEGPNAEHPQPPRAGSRALQSSARALWAGTARARAPAAAPPPARLRLPRARTRGLPCASPPFATCRMVRRQQLQRGVGGGGGGEGEAAPTSGGGDAAGRTRESWGRAAGGEPGWAQRSPSTAPLAVAPFCKAVTAVPVFLARASWDPADQEGFSPCCPLPETQNPKPERNPSCRPLFPS